MPAVYLSIGSNVDRERNVASALRALRARFGEMRVSTVYACPAEGFDGDDFYNLAAAVDTDLELDAVLDAIHAIEAEHGRRRGDRKFAPRTLDIDLLLYGDTVMERPGLHLPRDEILRYAFVLGPLAELAPDLLHPVAGASMADLWRDFRGPRRLEPVATDPADGSR